MKTEEELIWESYILRESLDNPYNWTGDFKTSIETQDWDDTGEEYDKDVLNPVQIIRFKTDGGIPYVWYARQNRYNDVYWEIAFGVETSNDEDIVKLNIDKTGTGNAFRIFTTVLDIINSFIEFDENYEVQYLTFTSVGDNRTRLYKKYLIPKIEGFEIEYENKSGDETEIHLMRNF
jgi:hypothetical protein